MTKYYSGVGSRKTPADILERMKQAARVLRISHGYILRSGGAAGADTAFEQGAGDKVQVFRPQHAKARPQAYEIAAKYHPVWSRLSSYVRDLHARNVFQILGYNLDEPSKFLLCWTPDGCVSHKERSRQTGGTGTAISIASEYGVPVFNLKRPEHLSRVRKMIQKG